MKDDKLSQYTKKMQTANALVYADKATISHLNLCFCGKSYSNSLTALTCVSITL